MLALIVGLAQTACATVAFTVTPSAVSNTFSGPITLQITGLTNTETVVVQKFIDANTNGVVDAGDTLWQQFNLTDGTNFVIGGVTNINVPGDTDGTANGQITAKLNFQSDFLQTIVGKYLFVLSSPVGHFAPLTNSFAVTNFPFGQKFTGTVLTNGVAAPNTDVILFQPSSDGNLNPLGGATANSSGVYTIQAAPGTYLLVPFGSSNLFANVATSPTLTLSNNVTITTNLSLTLATRKISGKIVDANNSSIGLPGLLVPVQTQSGLLAVGFTDTNGNFTAGVASSQWQIQDDSSGPAFHGYVGLQHGTVVDTTTGSVAGVTVALPKATAFFYGTVKDNFGNPLSGTVEVQAYDNNNGLYQADGYTDTNGNYVIAAVGGLGSNDLWQVNIDNSRNFPNYIFSQSALNQFGGTNLTVGKVVQQNFTAILATNHITGNVSFNGSPVVGVQVYASATIGLVSYQSQADTDTNGNYSLNVVTGNWTVNVYDCCDNDSLDNILGSGNYVPPGSQGVNIANNNGTANFTIEPCSGVQIITSSPLPDGSLNNYYSIQFQGSSCTGNLNWSVNDPQDLPPGLTLYSGGAFNGTPTSGGTYNFTVSLDDGNGNSTSEPFSVYFGGGSSGPLQVTTTSLPDGIVGGAYSQQLSASGGQPSYVWSLTPGSLALPPGFSLSTGGEISGTPTNAPFGGTNYYFSVRVTDSSATTADQLLSLAVYPALTMATNALPNGTAGIAYDAQILVSGGDPDQFGYGAQIFGSFPPGLNFSYGTLTSSNEFFVISGTPTNSGTFSFTLEADDADGNSVQKNYSIIILSSALQITTASLSNAMVGVAYTNQLQGSGGTTPYTWTIANGSQPLPSALTLATNGLISGVPAASGTNNFIARLTDHNSLTVTRSFTLITNPKPVLGSPNWQPGQFQMRLTGMANQNYTVQVSTNLVSTNWTSLFVTNNPTTNSFIITVPNATNRAGFYRALIGP